MPIAFGLVTAVAFTSFQLPGRGRFVHALQNSGHGLAFAALALASLLWLGLVRTIRPARLVAGVALALFALGAGIELAQHLTGRGATSADLLMNALGIVCGAAFALAARKTALREPGAAGSRTAPRVAAAGLGALALLWCLRLPIAILAIDAMAPRLPGLADFEQPFALAKLGDGSTPAAVALVEADPRWPDNPTVALEARFPTGTWPGFRLVEPDGNWRGHAALAFEALNPQAHPVRLNVRVDQRAAEEDIFWSASTVLAPGPNPVRIALEAMRPDIALDDRPDHEPFVDVSQVLFFLSRPKAPATLLIDDVRLLPAAPSPG